MKPIIESTADEGRIDKILTPAIDRLVSMIYRRYGCELQYDCLSSLAAEKDLYNHLQLQNAEHFIFQGRVYFPVYVKNRLVGCASVDAKSEISKKSLQAIQQVICVVIASAWNSIESLDQLEFIESNIARQSLKNDPRVISLAEYKMLKLAEQVPQITPEGSDDVYADFGQSRFSAKKRKENYFSIPCLIQSNIELDILKMALELHDSSGRTAFIHHTDLPLELLNNPKELLKIDSTTLFVADICQLSPESQLSLFKYLCEPRDKNSLHVIVGTTSNLEQLQLSEKIDPQLLRKVSMAYLKMNQAFEAYQSKGIHEFFLSGLFSATLDTSSMLQS